MSDVADALVAVSEQYLALHVRKEDLFWSTRMGLADGADAQREAAEAEKAWKSFLQDPSRLAELRRLEARAATEAERRVARGWIAMLSAHLVESREAQHLSAEIVDRESEIERQRNAMTITYLDPESGAPVRASSVRLALMIKTHPDERYRRAAFEGLRSIEAFVLGHDFLDIIKLRNRLARTLGFEDYYAWRVATVERMEKRRLFAILGDLVRRTKAASDRALDAFARNRGNEALEPWNFPFHRSGRLAERMDPYFGIRGSLRRWGRSFAALGVRYRRATLTLDLLDRRGKYENGFMHGPEPAFFDRGGWRPARINFTANAVLGQTGAGHRALQTLFHEGGHAAHFANVLMDAPCFSQEFAPTSVAYAETQSMFMDSLLDDASWMRRYAVNREGEVLPLELVRAVIEEEQPFRAWDMRAMVTVPFAERAIYELPDEELSPDRVLDICRATEQDLQCLRGGGVRPVLSVPHLLSGESSAYYHGYVLAEMAVERTRRFFLERDGHLTDNPRIGPDLAASYWSPGNSRTFDETLIALTGTPLSADALVDACNRTPADVLAETAVVAERMAAVPRWEAPVELDATIRVVHGTELIATTEDGGFETACDAFERWIDLNTGC
jgi:hypothetical protein